MRPRFRTAIAFLTLVGCSALAGAVLNSKLAFPPRPVMVIHQAMAPAQARPVQGPQPTPPSAPAGDGLPTFPAEPAGPLSLPAAQDPGPPPAGDPKMPPAGDPLPGANREPSPEPADPVRAVETFIKSNRDQAEATIKALNAEAEQLRARLAKVEDALARWEALSEALRSGQPGLNDPGMELSAIPAPIVEGPADEPVIVRTPAPAQPRRAPAPAPNRSRFHRSNSVPAPPGTRTVPPPAEDGESRVIPPRPRQPNGQPSPPDANSISLPEPGQPAAPSRPATPNIET